MELCTILKFPRQQWNRILVVVVTIPKYKKSTIDHGIYIKIFSDGTVSYLKVSTDDSDENDEGQKGEANGEEEEQYQAQRGCVTPYCTQSES